MAQVQSWGAALMTSVATALQIAFAALPRIFAFGVILILGWILSAILAKATQGILRTVKFDELAEKAGFAKFVRGAGLKTDAAGFLGLIVKWFVRVLALVVAFDALGLPAVSAVLREFLLWLPNLVVALVVLVVGGLLANAAATLARGASAEAGLKSSEVFANVARVLVWAFAIVVAVNQIGIASTLVNTLFMAVVGSAALAAALAFGLGGRETAGEMIKEWRQKAKEAKPKVENAMGNGREQIERSPNERTTRPS